MGSLWNDHRGSAAAAITADGRLYLWGLNEAPYTPTTVDNKTSDAFMSGVKQVKITKSFDVAKIIVLKNDGSLYAKGFNNNGQLGINSTSTTVDSFYRCVRLVNNIPVAFSDSDIGIDSIANISSLTSYWSTYVIDRNGNVHVAGLDTNSSSSKSFVQNQSLSNIAEIVSTGNSVNSWLGSTHNRSAKFLAKFSIC